MNWTVTDRQDFTKYRAALVEYNQEDVYRCRSIHLEATPLALLRDVGSHVLAFAETLFDAFSEYFNDEHLDLLFDPDSEGPPFSEQHCRWDVIPLLRSMLKSHEGCLAEASHDASVLGEWYSLLQTLNDVWLCDTSPPDNYIRVKLEADLPSFAKQLLEHEAQKFDPSSVLVAGEEERRQAVGVSRNSLQLDEGSAAQLGQLLVLSQATDWQWRQEAMYRAFWKWAVAFNERNAAG